MVSEVVDDTVVDRIMTVLAAVPDPEIPAVSVTDLGIVRGVRCDPPTVTITPTYTGCPATQVIEASVRAALDEAGFAYVAIETVLSNGGAPLTPDMGGNATTCELGDAIVDSIG